MVSGPVPAPGLAIVVLPLGMAALAARAENSVELGRYAKNAPPTPQIAQIKLALVQLHEFLSIEPLAVGST